MSKPKKAIRKFKLHDEGYDYSYREKQRKEKRKARERRREEGRFAAQNY